MTASQFRELSSLSSRCKWKIEKESSVLIVQKLCQNEYIVLSSIIEIQATNQNLCNRNSDTKNETTLLKLQNDHEIQ